MSMVTSYGKTTAALRTTGTEEPSNAEPLQTEE